MTEGELLLVAFIFALVYSAAYVPRVGGWLGRKLAGKGAGLRKSGQSEGP
jgi:hypothetical protein